MREDMHEGMWSPFDPTWYKDVFDRFISTADELFNKDLIASQGYNVPDADGSKSSIFRANATLNNSFNEQILRDTLKDLYENSTHKLIASNHDNTHFFQWHGHMSDMTFIPNTDTCEFRIPCEPFVGAKERDKYKMSQFFRKWISIQDILNNRDIFPWCCLIFIDQKISSEYEFHIDDHEVIVRMHYYEYWVKKDYPVYIYKFDTSAQSRVLISSKLCEERWNWKVPVSYLTDERIVNSTNVIVAINKIADQNIRKDGITRVEFQGDNLEFFKVEDGYIDMTKISQSNKIYIHSETTEWLWMSVIVPKFLHEYPILLPTDVVYRPYEPALRPVVSVDQDRVQHVKADGSDNDRKQVYIDLNGELKKAHQGWKQMIRPIVLSDAFDNPNSESYDELIAEVDNIRDLTVLGADLVESLRILLLEYTTDQRFNELIESIDNTMKEIHDAMRAFMDKRLMEYNDEYERKYSEFVDVMKVIKEEGSDSEWLCASQGDPNNFFDVVSPCIHIPREFVDKYYVIKIIHGMTSEEKVMWEDVDKFMGRVRFQRPIESGDFWTFEYNIDDRVWRPFHLEMEHHFPDVYVPKDPQQVGEPTNRIFKAFFFYSDTINVLNESRAISNPTPDWSDDSQEYYFDQGGTYRDIFMEKFYWMGVRAIYKGLLMTSCRWEALEHVIDNPSYQRFNDLFMQTMDPYFKLGLATYLKSDGFNFPFDDAVNRLQEIMDTEFLGYKKVTNFEAYLLRSWIPSYFDYTTKIMDDWDYSGRLLRRPKNTFDINRLKPILVSLQEEIFATVHNINQDISWILDKLEIETYRLDVGQIRELKALADTMLNDVTVILNFVKDLDLQIYSTDDIMKIVEYLMKHREAVTQLNDQFQKVLDDATTKAAYEEKKALQFSIDNVLGVIPDHIKGLAELSNEFNMDEFMLATNDLRSYLEHDKYNPDDKSLIGQINKFDDAWSSKVKEQRNKLFSSTTVLAGNFDPSKSYSDDEIIMFIGMVEGVKQDIKDLDYIVREYWVAFGYEKDQVVIDRLDYASTFLDRLRDNLSKYIDARGKLVERLNMIRGYCDDIMKLSESTTEARYNKELRTGLNNIVQAISYIIGKNKRLEAEKGLEEANKVHLQWKAFVTLEEEVFTRITRMAEMPSGYILALLKHDEMVGESIEYMNSVGWKYRPDSQWPNFSNVYKAEEVDLVDGGFLHHVGDIVYVPKLGSYKITAIEGSVSKAIAIEDCHYRNTTFRDPSWQANLYDTITDGSGMGVFVRPRKITSQRIINDEVIIPIITRIQNAIHMVDKCISVPNPHNNIEFQKVLDSMKLISSDWDDIVKVYSDYMTPEAKGYTDGLIALMLTLIEPCETFIENRAKVDLAGFMAKYERFIFDVYEYMEKNDLLDRSFYYLDEQIRANYNDVVVFYGNGTTWSDQVEIKALFDNVKLHINNYKTSVLDKILSGEDRANLIDEKNALIDFIGVMSAALNIVRADSTKIGYTTTAASKKIEAGPSEIHKDVWYKVKFSSVAIEGAGYQVGDIIELVPELPVDQDGRPMDELSDIVMNDVILLQVTEVEYGRVLKVQPMIDYAVPYKIWGLRDTKTRVGNGYGLKVDMYSYEVELTDSTLFNPVENDVSAMPPFDENDLFVFKFENIHDLEMGYEVFLGGKQITSFIQRHESDPNPLHPRNVDAIYINANDVMALQNSSIFMPAEHYFIYRLDEVEIKDPGAGYTVGQDIFVDTNQFALRLKVASLVYGPTKGIEEVGLGDINVMYNPDSPECENARVATDSLNNIDDEFNHGYYDQLTSEGTTKPATMSHGGDYTFTSKRFDDLSDGDRNKTFMYPETQAPDSDAESANGDPDEHWYLGNPADEERFWERIMNMVSPIHPLIPDELRTPPGKPIKGEYQMFKRIRIHNSIGVENTDVTSRYEGSIRNAAMVEGDFTVPDYAHLPKHENDWDGARVGSKIIVECDETHEGHRMLYTIRTFVAAGFFVYDLPEIADYSWDHVDVDWMRTDWNPDMPSLKAQYPTAPWDTAKSYRDVMRTISDKKHSNTYVPAIVNDNSYIHEITLDDLSVFNWTTRQWEDLHDETRWKLEVRDDPKNEDWGFRLTFLEEGIYSYDMSFFWNKVPETQIRNSLLKRNAVLSISAVIAGEINNPAVNTSVYTGRHLRIRKLFPYEQKETFVIGKSENGDPLGYEMNFKLANYPHFRNEIHLEDIKIFNKSAGRFENILDRRMFEVRFKDPKAVQRGYETQTTITQSIIGKAGEGFVDGEVWAWNPTFRIHVFGHVTTNLDDGSILTFTPDHCPNPPSDNISLEFQVYQHVNQRTVQMAVVMIEFHTERLEVFGDGYIHNVSNRYAPVPEEFKVICQYNLDGPGEYDIIISKKPRKWRFSRSSWMMTPTFHLEGVNVQQDHLYILTSTGRFPLVNPSTGKPSINVKDGEYGTDVTFLNIYKRYENLEIHSVPYPMRSVYVQRHIPKSGFIDLTGKLNKPLNKKYFEFWVNGKLLMDEVTIITPTKLFLHGLTSLKNFEIVEVNRDPNEYFSDAFLEVQESDLGKAFRTWNYRTYLDDALEGTLEGDNYTAEEQEYLLSPVWKQVEKDHPEYKNYPPNVDVDTDILIRSGDGDAPLEDIKDPNFQFMVIDVPTIEGYPISGRSIDFTHFGFIPIDASMIIDLLNEEWAEEIASNPFFPEHAIMTDDEWYGMTARLYDEYGVLVHTLNEAAYKVIDPNLLRININSKFTRIVHNPVTYDLT